MVELINSVIVNSTNISPIIKTLMLSSVSLFLTANQRQQLTNGLIGVGASTFVCLKSSVSILLLLSNVRLYFDDDGALEEIGNGFNVGPGHGLIVSQIGNNIRVNILSQHFFCKAIQILSNICQGG